MKVALVFGNERFGMTAEEVDSCSYTVNIQTDAPMQVRPAPTPAHTHKPT